MGIRHRPSAQACRLIASRRRILVQERRGDYSCFPQNVCSRVFDEPVCSVRVKGSCNELDPDRDTSDWMCVDHRRPEYPVGTGAYYQLDFHLLGTAIGA
jgi:hypothetical protein